MGDNLRLLFLIPSLAGGGAERSLILVLRHLNRSRFDPVLLTLSEENAYHGELPSDLRVLCLGKRSRWDFPRLCRGAGQVMRAEQPKIVVAFLTYANWIAVIARFLSRVSTPLVLVEQNALHRNLKAHSYYPLRLAITRLLHPRADGIVAISGGIRNEIVTSFGISADRCFVVPNPVSIAQVRALANEPIDEEVIPKTLPTIISCGRLAPQKNFPLLLRAFRDVREKQPTRLVILGEGPERRNLERLAAELGVADSVRFLGFQSNPFKYIARATVFALSSNWEGFGLVLVEAMACGTPVISSDCQFGPSEIITHGESGLLFPPGDQKALANVLLQVLQDEPFRRHLAATAQQRVERWDAEQIAREYEAVFDEVLRSYPKTLAARHDAGEK